MFGVKDLFTTINLLGGVIAICLCVDGRPYEAGLAVILGYFLGDTMDGYVARKLGTANEFGAEYDTISDHTAHVIAPAIIVYTVYKDARLLAAPWDQVLAMGLAASLVVSVSIRHARNIVAPVEFKGVWAGLPRSVLGFIAIGYCNSSFAASAPGGWWVGVVLMPLMGIATLTYLPFPSHRLGRSHHWYVKVMIAVFLATTLYALLFDRALLFDVFTFWMAGYSLTGWLSLTRDERARYRRVVEESLAQRRR
ncbi:MAG TPA: CDP-alcohol phosphatidyltransferase family protein [Kofleriaceae bacterium]|nr:CDP-alcohol phosphatidyltransferase family protein [Kofleriaceae bacterium]